MPQQRYQNFDDEDEIPMPRRGNWDNQPQQNNNQQRNGGNQSQRNNNQQSNKGNQQHNQQRNDDKPNFKPPPSIRVQPRDEIYQLVCRWQRSIDEPLYWITDCTYYVMGKGVVDTTYGIRPSQVVGFTINESTGHQRFIHQDDYEYGFVKEKLSEFTTAFDDMERIAIEVGTNPKRRRNSRSGQEQPTAGTMSRVWQAAIIIIAILTLILLFRGMAS